MCIPCNRDASPLGAPPRPFSDPGSKFFVVALSRSRISTLQRRIRQLLAGPVTYLAMVPGSPACMASATPVGPFPSPLSGSLRKAPHVEPGCQSKTSNAEMIKNKSCAILCDPVRFCASPFTRAGSHSAESFDRGKLSRHSIENLSVSVYSHAYPRTITIRDLFCLPRETQFLRAA